MNIAICMLFQDRCKLADDELRAVLCDVVIIQIKEGVLRRPPPDSPARQGEKKLLRPNIAKPLTVFFS